MNVYLYIVGISAEDEREASTELDSVLKHADLPTWFANGGGSFVVVVEPDETGINHARVEVQ